MSYACQLHHVNETPRIGLRYEPIMKMAYRAFRGKFMKLYSAEILTGFKILLPL